MTWQPEGRSYRETARQRNLRNVGKGQPAWDSPARSPSVWIFGLVTAAIIVLTFAALEFGEWIFGRWGG